MPDLTIGRLRGGFCVIWYDAGKRRRHQLAALTRKEAEAEAVAVYREKTFSATRATAPTVADMWDLYRADLDDRPTGKTMDYTGKAILPFFGQYLPADIDKPRCVEYADHRVKQGKSQGTVWTELGHLQSALNYAAKTLRLIDRAPHIWRPRKPETDKRILDAGECRKLIDGAHDPHIRLALIMLLGTAARVGAILDLTWDRVDFDRNAVNLRLPDAQTRKGRAIVPMNSGVRAALSTAYHAALSDHVVEYAGGPVRSIRKGVAGAIERSGIGHVTIHELRHTAAVHMLAAGIPIEKVAQTLGHSNVSVTYRIYGRYLPEHMQDAVDVLNFAAAKSVQ